MNNDIVPPKQGSQPAKLQTDQLVKAELVGAIPVKSQSRGAGPLNTQPQAAEKDLDSILQDVTRDVKNPTKAKDTKFTPARGIAGDKLKSVKLATVLPLVAALAVATILATAAIYTFNDSKTTTSGAVDEDLTNSPTATPASLEDFYRITQSQLSDLDDSQDFNEDALSDAALGL